MRARMKSMRWLVLAALVLGGLFVMAAAGGNTQPQCQPVDPVQPLCLTALDCDGESNQDCAGEWACVEGTCEWQCEVVMSGCYSDWDCVKGQHCSVADGECLNPPDCPMCDVCWGKCVDDQPDGCFTDADCEPGFYCQAMYKCGDATDSATGEEKCIGSEGVCVPICLPGVEECFDGLDNDCDGLVDSSDPDCGQGGCDSDADCAYWEYCVMWLTAGGEAKPASGADAAMACCPEGAYCADLNMVPCGGYGQCMMRPGYCWGDYDCAQGEHCEYPYYDDYPAPCADGTDCTGGAPKMVAEPGSCVPDAQPACYSDQDCPAGQFCDFGVSGPVEGCCGPWDEICLMIYPACEGVCEPRLPDGLCLDDADCAAGQACDFSNPLCVEQECYPNGECLGGCYGQCVAAQQGCTWDGDCAAGEYCAFTDWCGGARTDPDGNGQEMPAWCGEGVCTPVVVPQDCQRGGCSGELCVPYGTGVDSDCMWQPWYLCYDLARCERTPDGTCGWMGSTQFYNCMKENGAF